MQDERLIGYRPDLKYTDEYISDANDIFNSQDNTEENQNTNNNIIEDVIDHMEVIDTLINKLPGDASDIVGEVFDPIMDFVRDELEGNSYEKVPEEWEWNYETPETEIETPEKEPEFSEDNFWEDVDSFPIVKEEHTKQEVIEKEYIKNLTDLFDDYFTSLHNALSNYWTNLVPAILNKPTDEIGMLVNNILLSSSDIKNDAKHLLDSALRNQITRTMKIDYYANIFNAEETITHLKQFKAMYELRLRYANIKEKEAVNKTDQMNNNILQGMQLTYDKKYDIAYENLFRYLKSSVEILDDTLKTWIIEIKSKQTLIEGKGIK